MSAQPQQHSERLENWKKMAFLGPLPKNFLKIRNELEQQEAADHEAALALHMRNFPGGHQLRAGKLTITVSQAKLVKNYGVTRMDPYVRLRVGHAVYETHSDTNGSKNPRWNKQIQCWLPPGVSRIYIEIYDECSFTMDELIAWAQIEIPSTVIQMGETHEDWYPLNGKQGENQEGMINLVFSYTTRNVNPYMSAPIMMVPSTGVTMLGMPAYSSVNNAYVSPQPINNVAALPSTLPQAEEELKQIAEMFPNLGKETIESVYNAKEGNKALTINALLQLNE